MTVSINSDLGEDIGIHSFGNDDAILKLVDTVNVACGMHAGDPGAMQRTVSAAAAAGVNVGAHPGLPDIAGFGRRPMAITSEEARDLVRYQVGALVGFLNARGLPLDHIKPHGALFGMAASDEELMGAICEVARQYGVPVYGLAGTAHESAASAAGVEFVPEFYVDLDYGDDGKLIVERRPKERPLESVRARTVQALRDGTVTSRNGVLLPVTVESICVHSDLPSAPAVAQAVREAIAAVQAA
ncbi:5-oxoprolinase subunit PxpA [Arthrobacter gandavensis]|uniref:5-oxoprolinase subunit PxpA n=1 Tax=Arthrobacter gandavensis TaxID=169960 RepID=UPI00188F0191|nr:5-oxoprolinase subunit PxpA [Arthrobacter gandavensis]MBF4994388.1 5-oxoprolinase subunit PxpA [Arthrobacter gandavensis]